MVNKRNLLYSVSAALRILTARLAPWGKVAVIEKLSEFRGKFHAVYTIRFGKTLRRWSVYISKKTFKHHFVDRRKNEAQKLIVRHWEKENTYSVFNASKGTLYHVNAWEDGLFCECEDFSNQKKFLGKACCKHAYAVLGYLGFDSLKEYLEPAPDF